ncbi:hypothetical protein N8E86_10015 [Avibacterium paragallinarum]|uniref:hypothetical protein n=1 Tax=Avibacterium paragallinarum TaxID=728 RepID=UPI0021F71B1B|nr:hypothetical protein [Avibacterium paragallinarum]UXN34376.1 hypothetical protein N8E86_10015 [Avibacterium paragallinarum]
MKTELDNVETSSPKLEDKPFIKEDDLDRKAKEGKHKRHQSFQESLNCIVIIALWAIFIAVLACGLVYLWHMLTPPHRHFLESSQLEQIRTFVVTAILSSSLTNYANRHINEE